MIFLFPMCRLMDSACIRVYHERAFVASSALFSQKSMQYVGECFSCFVLLRGSEFLKGCLNLLETNLHS